MVLDKMDSAESIVCLLPVTLSTSHALERDEVLRFIYNRVCVAQ